MTDRIKMYCLKKCETCEGKGEFLEEESWDISAKELVKCDRCKGKGYTDSVIEFEQYFGDYSFNKITWVSGVKNNRSTKSSLEIRYSVRFLAWSIYALDKHGDFTKNVTDSLNPTHLEVITLKECSICKGMGVKPFMEGYPDKPAPCNNCTDGKIASVTQKTLFNPDEYDEALRREGRLSLIINAQCSIEEVKYQSVGIVARTCDEITERFKDKLKNRDKEELKKDK